MLASAPAIFPLRSRVVSSRRVDVTFHKMVLMLIPHVVPVLFTTQLKKNTVNKAEKALVLPQFLTMLSKTSRA